jgi:allantoinase
MWTSSVYKVGVEGGTVVSPVGRRRANVYVSDGKIQRVTHERIDAVDVVDASGCLVLPGMVDAHVHFMDPGELHREDFPSGTRAAAAAGVTTVIEHTHAAPVRTTRELQEKCAYLEDRAQVDFALAAHAWEDQDLESLWRAGVAFFKAFTCTTHGVPGWSYGRLRLLLEEIARLDAVCVVHCEDESLTDVALESLRAADRSDGSIVSEWRNREAELVALTGTVLLANQTGARVVVAHVSSPDAVETVSSNREANSSISIETCPQYLTLLESEVAELGPLRKFTPPARARSEAGLDRMWMAVERGPVDFISSDHAPSTLEQKSDGDIWSVPFGLPGVDTTMPLLLDAAATGRMSYERLVDLYSERPARTYGLFPRKGCLRSGSDADIVIVDPDDTWTITDKGIRSKAGWTPYEGRRITGRVVKTYVRGRLVSDGGVVSEKTCGHGCFVSPRRDQESP